MAAPRHRRHRWELRPGDLPPEWVLERAPELRGLEHNAIFRLLIAEAHKERRQVLRPIGLMCTVGLVFSGYLLTMFPLPDMTWYAPYICECFSGAVLVLWIGTVVRSIGARPLSFPIWMQDSIGRWGIDSEALLLIPDLGEKVALATWGEALTRSALRDALDLVGCLAVAGVVVLTAGLLGWSPFGISWFGLLPLCLLSAKLSLRPDLPHVILPEAVSERNPTGADERQRIAIRIALLFILPPVIQGVMRRGIGPYVDDLPLLVRAIFYSGAFIAAWTIGKNLGGKKARAARKDSGRRLEEYLRMVRGVIRTYVR